MAPIFLMFLHIVMVQLIESRLLYVRPEEVPVKSCRSNPCLTLEDYVSKSASYFASHSEFVFLAGSHLLQIPLEISDVTNVSLRGIAVNNESSTVYSTKNIVILNGTNFTLEDLRITVGRKKRDEFSALVLIHVREIAISRVIFLNTNKSGRAIYAKSSSIIIANCHFEGHASENGGALVLTNNSVATITGSSFVRNMAVNKGGALYVRNSMLRIVGDTSLFSYNWACSGCYHNSSLEIIFEGSGGAISLDSSKIMASAIAIFSHNKANIGGGLALTISNANFTQGNLKFVNNTAITKGGGMYLSSSLVIGPNLTFISNSAEGFISSIGECGTLCIFNTGAEKLNAITPILINNTGTLGGAFFAERTSSGYVLTSVYAVGNSNGALGFSYTTSVVEGSNVYFNNMVRGAVNTNSANVSFRGFHILRNNSGVNGAVGILNNSRVSFLGKIKLINNVGISRGGGITVLMSEFSFLQGYLIMCGNLGKSGGGGAISTISANLSFAGSVLFYQNQGKMGGALSMISESSSSIKFYGNVTFSCNKADTFGGAVHASGVSISVEGTANFSSNTARMGGALYLEYKSILNLGKYAVLLTSYNKASEYGGTLYHKDTVTDIQCGNVTKIYKEEKQVWVLPTAFLQVVDTNDCPTIKSFYDTAEKDGNFLYGGLLDRSRLKDDLSQIPYDFFTSHCSFNIIKSNNKNSIASEPYQLKFCRSGIAEMNFQEVYVYRGQTFGLELAAVGQGDSMVEATLMASTNSSAILQLNQNSHHLNGSCNILKFNLFSNLNGTDPVEIVTLHPDGLCLSIGQSSMRISVHLKNCPDAFVQLGDRCVCVPRLMKYANCMIEDRVSIVQPEGIKAWISGSYGDNGSYKGLIIYPTCPIKHCLRSHSDFYLDSPNEQCMTSRRGVLCGQCIVNHSLVLGGFQCKICSHRYLGLTLVFACFGVLLPMLISLSGFTVSTGKPNAFILYANIIQANQGYLFFHDQTNPLTIFVAWLSLDFGLNTCFYNGMDTYAHTWLQYVFPLYICILMSLMIFAGHRSTIISKLVGPNPTAVLATLLLLSYSKILRLVIDALMFLRLQLPEEKYMVVWMKDGNILYLSFKHGMLGAVTLLVFLFLFLPYTILMLLGQWLYRVRNRKLLHLLNKVKPLLVSYFTPYKTKTRYWTGLLFLVRCALCAIFSLNPLGGTWYSLFAIIVAFSSVGVLSWLNKGIYKDFFSDVVEVSIYLNLIVAAAAAATLSEATSGILTNVLVAVVFVTFMAVLVHHVHVKFIAKAEFYIKLKSVVVKCKSAAGSEELVVPDNEPLVEKTGSVTQTEVYLTH